MAKRKSKGGWPEDWREQIAGDDEEFLGALKEIADPVELGRLWNSTKKNVSQFRNELRDLRKYDRPDANHAELRHAAKKSLGAVALFGYRANFSEWERLEFDDGDLNFAFLRLFEALRDIDEGVNVGWLKVDRPVDIKGNKPPGRAPASLQVRHSRGECAGLMELLNREGATYEEAGTFIMRHMSKETFKWLADPRSKRSHKLLYTWLQAARKVGTTEHGGFNFVLKYDALRIYENPGRHTLKDSVRFKLALLGSRAGIASPDPDLEALE